MKKKILLILVVTFIFSVSSIMADKKNEPTPPKKAKVIAQSCSAYFLYITVIDLDTNEVVVLSYQTIQVMIKVYVTELAAIIRTGMIVNPDDYKSVAMSFNSPMIEEKMKIK